MSCLQAGGRRFESDRLHPVIFEVRTISVADEATQNPQALPLRMYVPVLPGIVEPMFMSIKLSPA